MPTTKLLTYGIKIRGRPFQAETSHGIETNGLEKPDSGLLIKIFQHVFSSCRLKGLAIKNNVSDSHFP